MNMTKRPQTPHRHAQFDLVSSSGSDSELPFPSRESVGCLLLLGSCRAAEHSRQAARSPGTRHHSEAWSLKEAGPRGTGTHFLGSLVTNSPKLTKFITL